MTDQNWIRPVVGFPDPAEIAPHAIAFARMMFAHTAFEREVGALQDAITKQPGFGQLRANQYGTRERPARMVELIEAHRGKDFPADRRNRKAAHRSHRPLRAASRAGARHMVGTQSSDSGHHRPQRYAVGATRNSARAA